MSVIATPAATALRVLVLLCVAVVAASCSHTVPRAPATAVEIAGFGACPGERQARCLALRVHNGTDAPVSFKVVGRSARSALHCHNFDFGYADMDHCLSRGKARVIHPGESGLLWIPHQPGDLERGLILRDDAMVEYVVPPIDTTDRR